VQSAVVTAPTKEIVSQQEMVDRIKAAVDARTDDSFVIMARTDALAVEGLESALDRAAACIEAVQIWSSQKPSTELDMYKLFADRVKAPILANITEFGATHCFTCGRVENSQCWFSAVPMYPPFPRDEQSGLKMFTPRIRRDGTQKNVIDTMQTRMELS